MKILLKTIFKSILLTLLVTILAPVIYFVWRAGQPMESGQFNGLTYYQYLDWRKMAYHQLAVDYQADHPDADVKETCFGVETSLTFLGLAWTGFYTLADIYPEKLNRFVNQTDVKLGFAPQGVTWITFLPSWWRAYENVVWCAASTERMNSYCRIKPDVPMPEELQAMKAEHVMSAATH